MNEDQTYDLTATRRFKAGAKLHSYLARNDSSISKYNACYSLTQILQALRNIISSKKLYDPNNTIIILCSPELEEALNIKFLHEKDLQEEILKQMLTTEPLSTRSSNNQQITTNTASKRKIHRFNITYLQTITGCVRVKPDFLKVIHATKSIDKTRRIFSINDVNGILFSYIMQNRKHFFDHRSSHIAFIKGSLLGKAFGMQAFHDSQWQSLLSKQLIPCSQFEQQRWLGNLGIESPNIPNTIDAPRIHPAQEPMESETIPTTIKEKDLEDTNRRGKKEKSSIRNNSRRIAVQLLSL